MKKLFTILALLVAINASGQWVNMNSPASRITSTTNIGNSIFIAAAGQGVYVSNNGGLNWSQVNNGISGLFVLNIISSGNNLFISTSGTSPKIYLSTNLGANWSQTSNGLSEYAYALFASGSYVYAGTSTGAHYTSNNGANWILSNLTNVTPSAFVKSGSTLFAGTYSNGVYKSTDNGVTWAGCSNGLTTLRINTLGVLGTDIFAGTDYGGAMYKTTNNGADWIEANSGIMHLVIRGIASQNGHIFASANDSYGCIYHSTNAGQSWIIKNQGFGTNVPTFTCLYIANDYVYAGTYSNNIWKRSYQDLIGIQKLSEAVPSAYSLSQNYPNPFNPMTNVKFSIVKSGNVKMIVYDIMGREIQTLVNERLQAGTYETAFDANRNVLTSGIYFCTFSTEGFSKTIKMTLVK